MSETQPLLYDQRGQQPPAYPDGYNNPPQETPVNYEPPPAYHYQGEPYPPAPQAHETVLAVNNTPPTFTVSPVPLRCPNCQKDVLTTIHYKIGCTKWLIILLLVILGLFFHPAWFFCCILCCTTSTKDVVHICPNCEHKCGVYHPSIRSILKS